MWCARPHASHASTKMTLSD